MAGDVKWKAGDSLTHHQMGSGLYTDWDEENSMQEIYESTGWRLAEQPAPPAEAAGVFAPVEPAKSAHPIEACIANGGRLDNGPTAKASAPVCHERCGMPFKLGVRGHWYIAESDGPCFCTEACRDAGRPLNPAVPPAGWTMVKVATWTVGMDWGVGESPPKCTKCPHRHVGPCGGTSPNGEYGCPCGHVAAKEKGTRVVGEYKGNRSVGVDCVQRIGMTTKDRETGATATLLANLAAEKPPVREFKVKRRYMPGMQIDE